MGLRARFSVIEEIGYPSSTPELGIPIDYSEGCDAFVDEWKATATDLVPVDTGYLQSTLTGFTDGEEVVCETLCDYAQYVEYGTIKMGAQPYFEPAIDAALGAATPLWDEAYQDALEEEQQQLEEMEEEQERGGNRWVDNQMHQQASAGGFMGSILGTIIAAVVVGFFNVIMDIAFGNDRGSSSGGSHYGGGDAVGGGSIEVEII